MTLLILNKSLKILKQKEPVFIKIFKEMEQMQIKYNIRQIEKYHPMIMTYPNLQKTKIKMNLINTRKMVKAKRLITLLEK